MDEAWERAVEAIIEGQATPSSELRVLNLDGTVKSLHGRLPPAELLERFPRLEHLSIANVGAPSLERFPRLHNLQRLILSDNRIAGGLESLVEAELLSLRDLDLSNNRVQYIEDLAPLAKLHLVSLDLYECPVTRVADYRSKVFSMIRTLKYLDKLDASGNERPESDDDEEEEDEEDEYEEDEEDPGSGEVDGGDRDGKLASGAGDSVDGDDGILDVDEDDGSDADEEMETGGRGAANESSRETDQHLSNGFRVAAAGDPSVQGDGNDGDEEDVEDEDDDDDLGEEIDEEGEDEDDEDDVVEVHDVLDSDEEDEDGVDDVEEDEEEMDEDDADDDGDDDDEVDVDEDEMGVEDEEDAEPESTCRLTSAEGEIDGHDHGEENENGEFGVDDENGEIGEEDEQGVGGKDDEDDYGEGEDEDDLDGEYLVQPIARPNGQARRSGFGAADEEDEVGRQEGVNHPRNDNPQQASPSDETKRRREEGHLDDGSKQEQRVSKRR